MGGSGAKKKKEMWKTKGVFCKFTSQEGMRAHVSIFFKDFPAFTSEMEKKKTGNGKER
jgi:hypothetical protein